MKKGPLFLLVAVSMLSGLAGATLSNLFFTRQAVATSVPERIMAREFVLVDANYKPRAVLKVGDKGALLALTDSKQNISALLQGYGSSGELFLADSQGKMRLKIGERDANGIGLRLLDRKDNISMSLLINESNLPSLEMNYPSGKKAVSLELINNKEAVLAIKGEESGMSADLGAGSELVGLTLSDQKTKSTSSLLYAKGYGSIFKLSDKVGGHSLTANVSPRVGAQMFLQSTANDYTLRLLAAQSGASLVLDQSKDKKYTATGFGVTGQKPWLALRHSEGSLFEAIFSSLGQPYLNVTDHNKKLWSVPGNRPPGVPKLRVPFIQSLER
jgi:hypothetical protein